VKSWLISKPGQLMIKTKLRIPNTHLALYLHHYVYAVLCLAPNKIFWSKNFRELKGDGFNQETSGFN